MKIADKLATLIGDQRIRECADITELRLRAERPARYRLLSGKELTGPTFDADRLRCIASALMEDSLYAREDELRQGFFTAMDGCRVGVCGRMVLRDGRISALTDFSALCIRIPRAILGCAEPLLPLLDDGGILVLSPPGLGKTTLLRDLARLASDAGRNVAIADERRELCACLGGIPQLDVGVRTDVLDGCPKADAIPMLIRACNPELIVADEIGGAGDAAALRDAVRCGAIVAASAHAASIAQAMERACVGDLLREGVFAHAVLLADRPGKIVEIRKFACEVDKK